MADTNKRIYIDEDVRMMHMLSEDINMIAKNLKEYSDYNLKIEEDTLILLNHWLDMIEEDIEMMQNWQKRLKENICDYFEIDESDFEEAEEEVW